MQTQFFSNLTDITFIDKIKHSLDKCNSFSFTVSFIKKPGLTLLAPNIEAALARGAKGKIITSTYQNFTDVESLLFFLNLCNKYPDSFECHLDKDCFYDLKGNKVGFHSKGYLFTYGNTCELLVGSTNITVFALLKNVEWDISVCDDDTNQTYQQALSEFDYLWNKTIPLSREIIEDYRMKLYYSIERWDMDYSEGNSDLKPNYMQRKALKELNRIRAIGAQRALCVAAAGSGKTYLAAFDAYNFNPRRLLYIVHEGSILMRSYETFQRVFGSDKSYGLYNAEYKEFDKDFVFTTNVTMAKSLELFSSDDFDYIVMDECHHAAADTYRKIIDYFKPQFLLGITATPERMDGEDIFALFDQNVPYELRLRDAIANGIVVPFHYFGIRDELIEYGIKETKGHRFVEQFSTPEHSKFIYDQIEKHRIKGQKLKALAFCRDISHAIRMSQAMSDYYKTAYLTGKNSTGERIRAYNDLQNDSSELEILFTVDILNEGVDIPGVNMVLFLRPTDSQTIFIQQLGRGLRTYEGKEYVTVLDFIGNDYKRSVQIAFALGSLSENFVAEKKLVADLIKDNFRSVGLEQYGVKIELDDLSKKDVLKYIDEVNFNTKVFLSQDYYNFKKYIGTNDYPRHVDYLNNDYAPNLLKFMKATINNKKNRSYYSFLNTIEESNIPSFSDRQVSFINYLSDMLPLVREYEYLIIRKLVNNAGTEYLDNIKKDLKENIVNFSEGQYEHALHYMLENKENYFTVVEDVLRLNIDLGIEVESYIMDLVEYGYDKYLVDFNQVENSGLFMLWKSYTKNQVQQLLLNNPNDIQKGTKIYNGIVYIYVTVIKGKATKENLLYADGYLDNKSFQWETEANISDRELQRLIDSKGAEVFVRKVENEDHITLPFTYIGSGKMEYNGGPKKRNGAYLFRISMDNIAPDDIYFDFKLPCSS